MLREKADVCDVFRHLLNAFHHCVFPLCGQTAHSIRGKGRTEALVGSDSPSSWLIETGFPNLRLGWNHPVELYMYLYVTSLSKRISN